MAIDTSQKELYAGFKGIKTEQVTEILSHRDFALFTRIELLAAALPTGLKETAREHYRLLVQSEEEVHDACKQSLDLMERLGLNESPIKALDGMPVYSAGLQLKFKTAKPYLSKDDDAFFIHDNPVRKEKVFRIPYMPASGWKGCLRAADGAHFLEEIGKEINNIPGDQSGVENIDFSAIWNKRIRRVRIFGNENAVWKRHFNTAITNAISRKFKRNAEDHPRFEQDRITDEFNDYLKQNGYMLDNVEGYGGHLHCFPTYFDRIGLEVINPHDRLRRVGTQPIYFESVPSGTEGVFGFLYLFKSAGSGGASVKTMPDTNISLGHQLAEDLEILGQATHDMLLLSGFGAKTSSGFGTAENNLVEQGVLQLKMPYPEALENGTAESCLWQVPFNTIKDLRKGFSAMATSLRQGAV
ncbi:uncharacterized protein Dvar_26980 [Desulfosarcina variabilis str. Montpellier]|uniref:RAMP superfamily CRISPR-associated protein n=1 Tax=Desulfosarcina variabilis TaxID=2300 RepID=UPI003AFAAE3A